MDEKLTQMQEKNLARYTQLNAARLETRELKNLLDCLLSQCDAQQMPYGMKDVFNQIYSKVGTLENILERN